MPVRPEYGEAPIYPDSFLPELQHALAALADIEIRYEIERDHLESGSVPRAIKESLLAELEQRHRADRELMVTYLQELRRRSMRSERSTPRRTEH